MKKIFLLVFISMAVCTLTYAQSDTTKTKTKAKAKTQTQAKVHKPDAMKQVGLTKDQKSKIKTANKNYKSQSAQIKGDSSLTASQKSAKLKVLNKQKKQQVDTVLTADQKSKLKAIHDQNKANSPQKTKTSPKTT